jgi:nitrile hydratase
MARRKAVPPRFTVGDRVRVRRADPRGRVGTIERVCGAFPNPEELAYNRPGLPAQPLYRVRFAATELWPDYRENPGDVVEVEIYQHWLEVCP